MLVAHVACIRLDNRVVRAGSEHAIGRDQLNLVTPVPDRARLRAVIIRGRIIDPSIELVVETVQSTILRIDDRGISDLLFPAASNKNKSRATNLMFAICDIKRIGTFDPDGDVASTFGRDACLQFATD